MNGSRSRQAASAGLLVTVGLVLIWFLVITAPAVGGIRWHADGHRLTAAVPVASELSR